MKVYYREQIRPRLSDFLAEDKKNRFLPTIVIGTEHGSTKQLAVNLDSISEIRYFLDVIENSLVRGK